MPDALWKDASTLNGKPKPAASAHAAMVAASASDLSGAPPPMPSIADASMATPTSPDATGVDVCARQCARVCAWLCVRVY